MGRLWLRDLTLSFEGQGGTLVVRRDGRGQMLRVRFDIAKTLSGTPNKGTIQITNLKAESRYQIKREFDRVRLEAGHVEAGNAGIIFQGFVRDVRHKREGPDIVTTVECGDGDGNASDAKGTRKGTISRTFPAGTTPAEMIDALLEEMPGVDRGVIHERVRELPPYPRPVVMMGAVRDELNKIGRTHRLYWSVQDGALEVIPGDGFIDEVTVISQRTGMIGVPDVTDNGIRVTTLLNPQIKIGRVIEVRSETLDMNDEQGRFRVSSLAYSGDTHADEYFTEIEAERIDGDTVDEGER